MIETADPASGAHAVAAEHKARLTDYVRQLLTDAGHPHSGDLAAQRAKSIAAALLP